MKNSGAVPAAVSLKKYFDILLATITRLYLDKDGKWEGIKVKDEPEDLPDKKMLSG